MLITIDGPAGAGKSSIAKRVAEELGFEFLDTGAMYRAVTLAAIRKQVAWDETDQLSRVAEEAGLQWENATIFLDGNDVSQEIRSPTVTAAIKYVADVPEIRKVLSMQQRRLAEGRDMVTDGRDQGTEVFPDADCKIFLTASPQERARRRQQQLIEAGRFMTLDEIIATQDQRDAEDRQRPVGALRPAEDACIVQSDGMTPEQVLAKTLSIIRKAIRTTSVQQSH